MGGFGSRSNRVGLLAMVAAVMGYTPAATASHDPHLTISTLDAEWPLYAETAFYVATSAPTFAVEWVGGFLEDSSIPEGDDATKVENTSVCEFTLYVYADEGGRPGSIIDRAQVQHVRASQTEGGIVYAGWVADEVDTSGRWIVIQAVKPAVPAWYVSRIIMPSAEMTRLVRAGELGLSDWQSVENKARVGIPSEASAITMAIETNPVDAQGTHIHLVTGSPTVVRVTLHDVAGREVTRVFDGRVGPEGNSVRWIPTRKNGQPITPGIYFVRAIDTRGQYTSTKVTLLSR